MQEDFRKKFVLLSQVAKEKKYAQEYLGLLARRGDLGSIRIGKRWYTTREWFWEFEKDIAAKKAEARISEAEIKPVGKEKIAVGKTEPKQEPGLQKAFAVNQADQTNQIERKADMRKTDFASLRIGRKLPTVDLRKIVQVKIQKTEKKSQEATKEFEVRNEARSLPAGRHGFSPSFAPEPVGKLLFLPRFAFGASLVLLFFLLFQIGFFYRKEILKIAGVESGKVAGAYSNRVDLSLVKNSSLDYLGNKGDKVKENVSFARVMLRAAMERSANSEQ